MSNTTKETFCSINVTVDMLNKLPEVLDEDILSNEDLASVHVVKLAGHVGVYTAVFSHPVNSYVITAFATSPSYVGVGNIININEAKSASQFVITDMAGNATDNLGYSIMASLNVN
jgi:hypothetical protein